MADRSHRRRFGALGPYCLAALLTLTCAEFASWLLSDVLTRRNLLYRPPRQTELADYLDNRDPDLGWPGRKMLGQDGRDATGARLTPAFPDSTQTACVSIYGDSFAWAEEVDAEHAWSNVLSRRVGCRVANYGVVGFGSDQAFLRYARNRRDRSKIVVLTHLSENILRNLNQLRNLLVPTPDGAVLKPRFVLGASGDIELVPIVTPKDDADLRALVDHPERLPSEWFAPGGPAGVSQVGFPYVISVARALTGFRMRAVFAGRPAHAEFYERNHPSHGLQISVGIAKAFVREAAARGASPIFVIIPLVPDFIYERKTGHWPYEPLFEALDRAGVPYLDTGALFKTELDGRDPCSLYRRCGGGHFNEEGNRLLGKYVYQWMMTKGVLSRGDAGPS